MKKIVKVSMTILLALFFTGSTIYFLGPKPKAPKLEKISFNLPDDLQTMEKQINDQEKATPGIKPYCEAKIIWADSVRKEKTKISILYIHGFGASGMEAEPIHRNIAKKLGANLYISRLPGHGIDLGDSTMMNITADDYLYSCEYALAIAKKLGDEVIILSNSFGGALSLWLASSYPEIKALVLYSPCIKTEDERAVIFAKPWGLDLVKFVTGSDIFEYKPFNSEYARYWTTRYHLDGMAAFQCFLLHTMKSTTFEKIKCPVFMGYWYKNENEKDTIASVPAMLEMFNELSSKIKKKYAFPNAGNHEICTPILSKDVEAIQSETVKFLRSLQEK